MKENDKLTKVHIEHSIENSFITGFCFSMGSVIGIIFALILLILVGIIE